MTFFDGEGPVEIRAAAALREARFADTLDRRAVAEAKKSVPDARQIAQARKRARRRSKTRFLSRGAGGGS